MCMVRCISLISIKKRNRLRFSCISHLHFVTFAAYSVLRYFVFWVDADGSVFRDTPFKALFSFNFHSCLFEEKIVVVKKFMDGSQNCLYSKLILSFATILGKYR